MNYIECHLELTIIRLTKYWVAKVANVDINDLLKIREPNEIVPLEEFILSIVDDEFRECCISMFTPYKNVILNINHMYGILPEDFTPQIYVHKNSLLSARTAFGGIIELGDSFIKRCLVENIPDFKEIAEEYQDDLNVEGLASIVSMMWTYSHEYVHYVRKHEDVITRLKELEGEGFDKQITDYALERDADLCAIAVVFRYLQHIHKGFISDLMLRQLVIYLIFWWLRPQLTLEHEPEHLSVATRLQYLISKLAVITEINSFSQKVDVGMKEKATQDLYMNLLKTAVSCENIYRERYDRTDGSQSMRAFIESLDKDRMWKKTVDRWEEIRTFVSQISNTLA